jgi:hypothetical protein
MAKVLNIGMFSQKVLFETRRAIAQLEEDAQTLQDICDFDERLSSCFICNFRLGLSVGRATQGAWALSSVAFGTNRILHQEDSSTTFGRLDRCSNETSA